MTINNVPNTAAVAQLLADAMADKNLTQTDVAAAIGVSQTRVSAWARGAARIPAAHWGPLETALQLPPGKIEETWNSPTGTDTRDRLDAIERRLALLERYVLEQLGK